MDRSLEKYLTDVSGTEDQHTPSVDGPEKYLVDNKKDSDKKTISDQALRGLSMGAGSILEGAAGLPLFALDLPSHVARTAQAFAGIPPEQRLPLPSQEVGKFFQSNFAQPETPAERYISASTKGLAGLATGFGAGSLLPAESAVGQFLTAQPARQAMSATGAALASQTAAESGATPLGQFLAGLAGGAIAGGSPRVPKAQTVAEQTASDVINAGFSLPPGQTNPTIINKAISLISDHPVLLEKLGAQNEDVVQRLVKQSLGLSEDAHLTPDTLAKVRADAGKAYEDLKNASTAITPSGKAQLPIKNIPDQDFKDSIRGLTDDYKNAMREFPSLFTNMKGATKLQQTLLQKSNMSTDAVVELVKKLRSDATHQLQNYDDPGARGLGMANKAAANALDELLDRTMTKNQQPELVANYRQARQRIAQAHNIEDALNPDLGTVDAKKLSDLSKGIPLTGPLKAVSQMGSAFPKLSSSEAAAQSANKGLEKYLPLLAAGLGAGGAHYFGGDTVLPAIMGGTAGLAIPQAARAIASSRPFQRGSVSPLTKPVVRGGLPISSGSMSGTVAGGLPETQ
jgi:hypothetical protein